MSVTAKTLFNAQYALTSATTAYTVPAGSTTIIDKFTATNTTGSAVTLAVYLVPTGGTAGSSNSILAGFSLAANTTADVTQLQNQILGAGDFISVLASSGSAVVIRGSGREISA